MSAQHFIDAIKAQSPNGEPVLVQFHPNGDWSVFDNPSDILTRQLRALRLPDEAAVILSIAVERNEDCEPDSTSAIRVTVEKHGEIATSAALRLKDALLMARSQADRQIEAKRKARDEAKAKAGAA